MINEDFAAEILQRLIAKLDELMEATGGHGGLGDGLTTASAYIEEELDKLRTDA